jgi:hypothetical protein
MDALRGRGHAISYDWTRVPEDSPLEAECVRELEAVRRSQALVLVPHTAGRGHWTELGMALALGKPVVALGWKEGKGMDCIFMHHPLVRHAGTLAQVLAYLEEP